MKEAGKKLQKVVSKDTTFCVQGHYRRMRVNVSLIVGDRNA